VLKLRKVELLGFKSFCDKTPITFSGMGITCIVGPNGCGKSNVVDAISWVLGEQSHKMLRAERMSDCIFNGTTKRPALGLAEVTLTLIDPELSEAAAKVLDGPAETDSGASVGTPRPLDYSALQVDAEGASSSDRETIAEPTDDPTVQGERERGKSFRNRRGEKPHIQAKPGELVVGRRLYRSGQSEYLINGRVARLRDVQELFMGVGLGPDSYAIIEQGRIGQILNSKPMDRRAIIEEAAGITMYKTKRRLAEAKLEASKINLARVNDILVEVEKQLASLRRQASKARRYAEIREQMRGLLRIVLASKAQHLDIEAARLETLLREMDSAECRQAQEVHELEADQERLTARTYSLDGEIRQAQNMLGQTALDLDRAENRITFNREQLAQIDSRAARLAGEIEQVKRQSAELEAKMAAQQEMVASLRQQTAQLETALRETIENVTAATLGQELLEARMAGLHQLTARLVEQAAREQAESLQAEESAVRHAAAEEQRRAGLACIESECTELAARVEAAGSVFQASSRLAQDHAARVRESQASLAGLRHCHQETARQLERTRESLSGARAHQVSIQQILNEHAYTADAVQKLFSANGEGLSRGFRAAGLLADYAEVEEQHEAAIEQFLRDELEYVVVESFDHARAGICLLRDEMGGRATFFVDSLNQLNLDRATPGEEPLPEGAIARLDCLVEFREPLGPAAKLFISKLRAAYLVETPANAEHLAAENPRSYFLTPEGTCYHGRTVSGGRQGEAGPLALKRELRHHESDVVRLEAVAQQEQAELSRLASEIIRCEAELAAAGAAHMEAEKSVVSATYQRDQASAELRRSSDRLSAERGEIETLCREAQFSRDRAAEARRKFEEAVRSRAAAEGESAESTAKLCLLRQDFQGLQDRVAARREELAAMSERLSSSEAGAVRMHDEIMQARDRIARMSQQHEGFQQETTALETSCEQLGAQVKDLRREKARLDESKASLEAEWEQARERAGRLEESLRGKRQLLEETRSETSQRQIEKARNDADRDYLRQTCVAELNAQPEELLATNESQMVVGEELIAAEANYNEMKARIEAMGPVNMMALEEYRECEERDQFLRREHSDLIESIQNTELTINELDQVSRRKFEEAFFVINSQFAGAFTTLFGGGHGEMRLSEPDSSGEAGIDIVAQPPGKKLQNILLLSGGEKALTALALLIAVFKYQPSPFCILDEVDAPLDEANVGRFTKMLADMCGQTQFIVVTHNRKTMEMGSVLYGVTMQEPGVSKLVSVKWEDSVDSAKTDAASNAA
jgi:chromosome segregation protein